MAALETSSIIPALLEVGQSPNAFFVNVTKCKATATAALLYPFPTHSHINLLLHLPLTRLKFNSPETGSKKTLQVRQVIGLGNTHPHLGQAELDLGKREWGQPAIFHL